MQSVYLHSVWIDMLTRAHLSTLPFHLLAAPVADSIPNLLSEIHDKVLATATQERQVAMATVPSSHSQLDSQEKQRMIKAYGNFEDEDVYLCTFHCPVYVWI